MPQDLLSNEASFDAIQFIMHGECLRAHTLKIKHEKIINSGPLQKGAKDVLFLESKMFFI
jgi:hypothetical protein